MVLEARSQLVEEMDLRNTEYGETESQSNNHLLRSRRIYRRVDTLKLIAMVQCGAGRRSARLWMNSLLGSLCSRMRLSWRVGNLFRHRAGRCFVDVAVRLQYRGEVVDRSDQQQASGTSKLLELGTRLLLRGA